MKTKLIAALFLTICAARADLLPTPTPTPAPAVRVAAAIRQAIPRTYTQLVTTYNALMKLFWETPGTTPQAVADELGTDAAALYAMAAGMKTFILAINPAAPLTDQPAGYTVTPHEDGTVTISYTAP